MRSPFYRKNLLAGLMFSLLASALLSACGDATSTPAAVTTAAATTAAIAPTTVAVPKTAVPTTAAATTAAMVTTATAPTTTVAGTTAAANANLTFKDKTGTTITLSKTPERIACLTGICLDMLAELGVEPVLYWDSTALLPEFFGDKAKSYIKVGGTFAEPNIEDIVRAKPDLVIGLANNHEKTRDALKSSLSVALFDPTTYNEAVENLKTVGQVLGKSEQANAAAKKFLDKLEAYKSKSPKNKTALFIWSGAVNSTGIDTAQSPYGSILAQVTNYPWPSSSLPNNATRGVYSLEKVLEVDPDVIFAGSFMNVPNARKITDWAKDNPVWSQLKAVKNNQVYDVDVQVWVTPRGTRGFGLVLDQAMTKLYPDVFPKPLG